MMSWWDESCANRLPKRSGPPAFPSRFAPRRSPSACALSWSKGAVLSLSKGAVLSLSKGSARVQRRELRWLAICLVVRQHLVDDLEVDYCRS